MAIGNITNLAQQAVAQQGYLADSVRNQRPKTVAHEISTRKPRSRSSSRLLAQTDGHPQLRPGYAHGLAPGPAESKSHLVDDEGLLGRCERRGLPGRYPGWIEKMLKTFGCWLLVGGLVLAPGPVLAEPGSLQLQRAGDRMVREGDRLVLYSRTGIGTAMLSRGQAWTEPLIVRFCYESGLGMTRIEGLRLRGETVEARGSIHEPNFLLATEAGENKRIPINFRLVNEAYELTVPHEILADSSFLEIHWVDVYR